jgi:hypothetical protein
MQQVGETLLMVANTFAQAGRPAESLYTIHIIVNTAQPALLPPQNVSHATTNPAPTVSPAVTAQAPAVTAQATNQLRQVEESARQLQESLVQIQRQIDSNRVDLRSVQQRIAQQHQHLGTQPHPHTPINDANGQPIPPPALHGPQAMAMNIQLGMPPFGQQMRPMGNAPPVSRPFPPHNHPFAPPHGPHNHTHGHIHAGLPNMGTPHRQLQEVQGPNGQRMRVLSETMSFQVPIRPSSAPGHPPPSRTLSQQQPRQQQNLQAAPTGVGIPIATGTINLPATNPLAQNMLSNLGLGGLPINNASGMQNPANTTAWLLSSPTGPRALLFAPGHGYFSSSPPATTTEAGVTSQTRPNAHPVQGGHGTADNRNVAAAQQALVPANPPQPAPGVIPAQAQAQQNGEENDIFAFIINRGWLFLRLYLFMFVFSEPGTWKRWVMIIAAAIVCLQPRNGPISRLMTAARRHFDNLVGPPTQRPAQNADQQQPAPDRPRGEGERPANVRGAVQMTPEEAAARIIRERQEQQNARPRPVVDAMWRIEQSIALFLASLVPGVGERHVRAREEVRREERRQVEEQNAETETAGDASQEVAGDNELAPVESVAEKDDVAAGRDGQPEQSTSTSVDVRTSGVAGSGEIRNRAT